MTKTNPYFGEEELANFGLKRLGTNVLISRKASLYNVQTISVGNNVRIDDFCILSGDIVLGNYIHISAYSALYGTYGIEMADFTGLSPRCTIFSASDDFGGNYLISPMVPDEYTNIIGGKVTLNRYCQIGSGSVVLPSVTLNEGVAVGAMSLVRSNLDAWNIYAGNPLKLISRREKGLLKYVKAFSEKGE